MIGVIADSKEHGVVREFFELFKTPWEFYRNDRRYEVLLSAGGKKFHRTAAKLVLIYAGTKIPFDAEEKSVSDSQRKNIHILSYQGRRIPIYGDVITFPKKGNGVLTDENSQQSAAYLDHSSGRVVARIGYDLFQEVRALLTAGQPPANADAPTLELHIAFLRDLIIGCGVPLVEIPPVPAGYQFIACLTHDVDHPSIRQHKWDHTMFGFLYRALLGSLINVFRGRVPVRTLLTNWAAALRLPLIHVGLAKDFWSDFDRYLELEKGLGSTFFVIPAKGYTGRTARGLAPKLRASRYAASNISGHIQTLMSSGCEIGLHGIDAWLDSSKGREELEQIRRVTGMPDIGVRMHWLYADEQSPVTLERAGAVYDSTIGYNETVGYRAGTTQVYKPLEAAQLLELPLHVMDTALFFPRYLDLSPKEASKQVGRIIDNAVQFGGCVTVNWHDRSIAPERLWGDVYVKLVGELKSKGAWFATASQAVSWFRKRRSAVFETVSWESGALRAKVAVDGGGELPGLRLQIHKAREPRQVTALGGAALAGSFDIGLEHSIDTRIAFWDPEKSSLGKKKDQISRPPSKARYVIISPVKDEEKYVETTLQAVLRQTLLPARWIIVDDGSRDRTREIVERFARREDWITFLPVARKGAREPGAGVVRAFAAGYELVRQEKFDFVVKLDCDLDFAPEYFENLLARFEQDESLGIASGIYLEKRNGRWVPIRMPSYHAAGASKVIRWDCFRDIGGFVPQRGWDTVDEIRAQAKGWKTRHWEELKLYHLKDEGSGIGFLRTNFIDGEIHYVTGGGTFFFLLKSVHRILYGRPFLLGGLGMALGFLISWVRRRPLLVNESESRFYRRLLNRRIADKIVARLSWVGVGRPKRRGA